MISFAVAPTNEALAGAHFPPFFAAQPNEWLRLAGIPNFSVK